MKHKIYSLVTMLTMALALTSCFTEEEKVPDNSSQATAIVAFSIKEMQLEKILLLLPSISPQHIGSI